MEKGMISAMEFAIKNKFKYNKDLKPLYEMVKMWFDTGLITNGQSKELGKFITEYTKDKIKVYKTKEEVMIAIRKLIDESDLEFKTSGGIAFTDHHQNNPTPVITILQDIDGETKGICKIMGY